MRRGLQGRSVDFTGSTFEQLEFQGANIKLSPDGQRHHFIDSMFMKNIKTVFIATALLGAVSLCLAQAETKTTLTKLHQSYEKQGRPRARHAGVRQACAVPGVGCRSV